MNNKQIHALNAEIDKRKRQLIKIEDYMKTVQALVPLIELANKMSLRADIEEGVNKNTWRVVLADVLTTKEEISEIYSGLADTTQELVDKLSELKGK